MSTSQPSSLVPSGPIQQSVENESHPVIPSNIAVRQPASDEGRVWDGRQEDELTPEQRSVLMAKLGEVSGGKICNVPGDGNCFLYSAIGARLIPLLRDIAKFHATCRLLDERITIQAMECIRCGFTRLRAA